MLLVNETVPVGAEDVPGEESVRVMRQDAGWPRSTSEGVQAKADVTARSCMVREK